MKTVVNRQSIGIIYQAYNTLTKKSYVGQTVRSLAMRKYSHYHAAKTKKHKFAQALKKYAKTDWVWRVLIEVPIKYLDEYETFFISKLNSYHGGYNSHPGGCIYGSNSRPKYNSTVYDVYHPQYGIVSGKICELIELEPGLSQISQLLQNKRSHIRGWVLASKIDDYDHIYLLNKIFDFYHPSYGIISCTRKELQEKYLLGERSFNAVSRLIKFPDVCCNGWILAKNKDRYNEIAKAYQVITLVHKTHGEQTLTRKEFIKFFGLKSQSISKILEHKINSSLGWQLPQQLKTTETKSLVELTHPIYGVHKLTRAEFKTKFGLTRHGLSGLTTGIIKTHKDWSLSKDEKPKHCGSFLVRMELRKKDNSRLPPEGFTGIQHQGV
jgi:hypothetical protein